MTVPGPQRVTYRSTRTVARRVWLALFAPATPLDVGSTTRMWFLTAQLTPMPTTYRVGSRLRTLPIATRRLYWFLPLPPSWVGPHTCDYLWTGV